MPNKFESANRATQSTDKMQVYKPISLNSNCIGGPPIPLETYEFDDDTSLVLAGCRYQSEMMKMKYEEALYRQPADTTVQ